MIPFPEIEKIAEPQVPIVEQTAAWWWWAAAILFGLLLGFLLVSCLVALFRRAALPAIPPLPEKIALRQIKALRNSAAPLKDAEFGSALSGIIRSYLHRRMGMLARYATTEEILGTARRRDTAPPPPVVGAFASVLNACDALKFASTQPGGRDDLFAAAERAVREVSGALRQPPALDIPQSPPLPEVPHATAS